MYGRARTQVTLAVKQREKLLEMGDVEGETAGESNRREGESDLIITFFVTTI